MPKSAPKPRPRNAAATRQAILASARRAFAEHGYDGAGVREIAAGAGVTAMMVNRYFGSKEQLFAEAVAASMADPVILAPENLRASDLAKVFAHALAEVTRPGAAPLDGFAIMLRSAANPRAAEIARREIEKHHHKTMTAALAGEAAALRAGLILSLVAGVQVMRQGIGLTALKGKADKLEDLLTSMLQALIDAG